MQSIKLSVTCRKALERKYDVAALKRIRQAIKEWVAADAGRGFKTVHVELDDPKAMKRHGVKALSGKATAGKVKQALDALVARLGPDYVVLIGAADVVPMFEVVNPTAGEDDEPSVPTDNPYACSRKYSGGKRSSYLVPDRVVGRIPDLVGSGDPSWLCSYLAAASVAVPAKAAKYAQDLAACCDSWKKSGARCVAYIGHDPKKLLISPPALAASKALRARHGRLLHMIKCHGAEEASRFYGQKGSSYPDVLTSPSIRGRTKRGTVVGAMCCYGASVFDPTSQTALNPGEPPIPSVYLKQGAHGFFGATNTAWVGPQTMMCADWVVAAFLKGVLSGSSLGRAALEAKQDFVRWNQQQGDEVDSADEKTLLQFVLLGDPAIHPVETLAPAALPASAARLPRPLGGGAMARRQRRATRHRMGELLRDALPERVPVRRAAVPKGVRELARACAKAAGRGFRFRTARPAVQRLERKSAPLELASASVRAGPAARARLFQYSWSARRKGARVSEIRLVSIQADPAGNPVRVQVLASSRRAR